MPPSFPQQALDTIVRQGCGHLTSNTLFMAIVISIGLALVGCSQDNSPQPGEVQDEAMRAGRTVQSFPAAEEDYFRDMDGGYKVRNAEGIYQEDKLLSKNAVRGRNTWVVWTGGNDRFWDFMANNTFGAFDLLKTLSSHPHLYASRDNRWEYLGLVNEPCFEKAAGPDPERWGLWLDKRIEGPGCPPDPFADPIKYPGVKIGARGTIVDKEKKKELPVGSFYGEPSGIVGLRLFPNPDFDEKAAKHWDAKKFYEERDYYRNKKLVRPYRVGMSCAFCHVGPSPTNPPNDFEHPQWKNLNSNPGAQYYWVDRIFIWNTRPRQKPNEPTENERNFIYQLFHTNLPGTLDTSLVSTDYINNPRTMNAVYSIRARLEPTRRWAKETLAGGELDNKQFGDFPETGALARQYWDEATHTVWTARVLKDGADSVGVLGALNRVYLNIGLFSEEWLLHFRPVIGGQKISPIRIKDAQRNSTYWNATVQQTPDMVLFFLDTSKPDKLAEAPRGEHYLTASQEVLTRGKLLFADRCAACHSSKIPPAPPEREIDVGTCDGGGNGPHYLTCWDNYWKWTQTDEFKQAMRELVLAPDFLDNNYLSTERRVPVSLLETNLCSALATNAIKNDIWDNFSSQSYKNLPAVGSINVLHPITGESKPYKMPAGGLGYTRPASLVSLWSTAPFLLNNSVGTFYWQATVEARMQSFDTSIRQMLWPERRRKDIDVITELGLPASSALKDAPGYVYRTNAASCLQVPRGYLPDFLQKVVETRWLNRLLPWIFAESGDLEIGPLPKGTPVSLLTNLRLIPETDNLKEIVAHKAEIVKLLVRLKKDLKTIGGGCSDKDLRDETKLTQARNIFLQHDLVDQLVALSKCPDYVVNRGHYFGADLADSEKEDLIEYLKTF